VLQTFPMDQDRARVRLNFARLHLGNRDIAMEVASADASFRSYWRVCDGDASWIVMDAPQPQEDVGPWLDIGARLRSAGLHAPEVIASDPQRGFVLMEDLGTRTYLPELNDASVDALYGDALVALIRMQTMIDASDLAKFDATKTIPELELMPPWFLQRHLGFVLDCGEWDVIENAFRLLAGCIDEQPQRFIGIWVGDEPLRPVGQRLTADPDRFDVPELRAKQRLDVAAQHVGSHDHRVAASDQHARDLRMVT